MKAGNVVAALALGLCGIFLQGSGITQMAYRFVQDHGTPIPQSQTLNFTGIGVNCSQALAITECAIPGALDTQQFSITIPIDGYGAPIATGTVNVYPMSAFLCEIRQADISADQVGSIVVDIWKRSGAIPTAANKISASSPVTLSSSQLHQSNPTTGWSTFVFAGDVFGATVVSTSSVQRVTITLWCTLS